MRVKSNGKKPLLIGAALALVVALSIGLTSAFLTSQEGLTNTFTPGKVSCKVVEEFVGNAKSSIKVQNIAENDTENTKLVPAYIRVAVVANTVDEKGNITGSTNVSGKLGGTDWTQGADGYYYYTKIVEPQQFTSELVKTDIPLSGIQVTVLAQAIQAHGVTGETAAVKDAWGSGVSDVAADGSLVIKTAVAGN